MNKYAVYMSGWKEHLESTNFYCPNCGKQTVLGTHDGGDYYVGETYFCESCNAKFNLPHIDLNSKTTIKEGD